jgi:hypothetical protein
MTRACSFMFRKSESISNSSPVIGDTLEQKEGLSKTGKSSSKRFGSLIGCFVFIKTVQ